MVRSELITRLAKQNSHLSIEDVTKVVDAIFGKISETLEAGGRVELRGFGVFHLGVIQAHTGRNPRTGESLAVERRTAVRFKIGNKLRERLNLQKEDE